MNRSTFTIDSFTGVLFTIDSFTCDVTAFSAGTAGTVLVLHSAGARSREQAIDSFKINMFTGDPTAFGDGNGVGTFTALHLR